AIELSGAPLVGRPTHEIARRGVAYVPEGRRILGQLTVAENLAIARRHTTGAAWDAERVFSLFPRLAERRRQLGATLSGGEQQMLAIGRALMGNPSLLLLDEPTQGLAPQLVRALEEVILEIHAQGITILLVEQSLRTALQLGQRHYLLTKGQVVAEV